MANKKVETYNTKDIQAPHEALGNIPKLSVEADKFEYTPKTFIIALEDGISFSCLAKNEAEAMAKYKKHFNKK